jgi:predicted nucleic acid-binding protein
VTVVVDASVVVMALLDEGRVGRWAEELVLSGPLPAPHLMPVEVVNVLRRSVLSGSVSQEVAALALEDLAVLPVELFPYGPLAARVWELRATVSAYDGWYVALAEDLGAEFATVDERLRRAPGIRCVFAEPPV